MSLFALVDCNNFFVSCERVFNPKLKDKPVIVLSNNDGCVISRSNEAKALGIGMGVPYFEIRELVSRSNTQVYSGNFRLYGDMSQRVIATLRQFDFPIEVYSIDEAFLSLPLAEQQELQALGHLIQQTVLQWTGIPISIGIAPSKTLAKTASEIGKKSLKAQGVVVLTDTKLQRYALSQTPVEDVWGVGHKTADKLKAKGIQTALQLSEMPDDWVLKQLHITGLKMVHELRGTSCLSLQTESKPRKSILSSRSFGSLVESLDYLKEAISTYTTRAAEKLREDNLLARQLTVYIRTSRHRRELAQYSNAHTNTLAMPTSCTHELINIAIQALEQIYASGYRYYKAGVVLSDLIPANQVQQNLFDLTPDYRERWTKLMHTLDQVNLENGQGTLRYASEGYKKPWQMKRYFKSQQFTTGFEELLKVQAI